MLRANLPFTTRPSTKSLPNGLMMDHSGRHLWRVYGISRSRSTSTSACSMATGPTPWPKKGRWHRLFRPQAPQGRESHRHHRPSWLRLSASPRGSRQCDRHGPAPGGPESPEKGGQRVRLDLRGAYLNLDGGFDSTYNRSSKCNGHGQPRCTTCSSSVSSRSRRVQGIPY